MKKAPPPFFKGYARMIERFRILLLYEYNEVEKDAPAPIYFSIPNTIHKKFLKELLKEKTEKGSFRLGSSPALEICEGAVQFATTGFQELKQCQSILHQQPTPPFFDTEVECTQTFCELLIAGYFEVAVNTYGAVYLSVPDIVHEITLKVITDAIRLMKLGESSPFL